MKKFILGVAAGAAVMLLVVLGLMWTGTPTETVILKYGPCEGNAVVACPKFVIMYMDVRDAGAGSCPVAIAGRDGTIPAFWRGYGTGYSGGETGIDMLHTYDRGLGVATIFVHGHIIRVENDGADLRVQDKLFRLDAGRVLVIVDTQGHAWAAEPDKARQIIELLPPWFLDNQLSACPIEEVSPKKPAAPVSSKSKSGR
jgi:hypothetical protein